MIGRNEGERLRACLDRVKDLHSPLVYVDSGSSDGSLELAASMGADAIDLQPPFSAGRGRNAGFAKILSIAPNLDYVQFLEGDCQLESGWLEAGTSALDEDDSLAAVSGVLRERQPESSVYNRLCSLEWKLLSMSHKTCGGNSMMRVAMFEKLGGFDESLIAGEEPEFCLRMRQAGWKITGLAAAMATHDAAMTRFSQWWRRSIRNGYSYAAGADLHGKGPERFRIRETRSNWFWGLLLPSLALLAIPFTAGWSLLLLLGYPVLYFRVLHSYRRLGFAPSDCRLLAASLTLEKLASAWGQLRFLID
ncbi:MAG: glycosyltransferase family 2 protein, partial [Planctomycetota bacterium]